MTTRERKALNAVLAELAKGRPEAAALVEAWRQATATTPAAVTPQERVRRVLSRRGCLRWRELLRAGAWRADELEAVLKTMDGRDVEWHTWEKPPTVHWNATCQCGNDIANE